MIKIKDQVKQIAPRAIDFQIRSTHGLLGVIRFCCPVRPPRVAGDRKKEQDTSDERSENAKTMRSTGLLSHDRVPLANKRHPDRYYSIVFKSLEEHSTMLGDWSLPKR
jgi:hypothetical protein